ncbi:MAG: FAD-binding protein, partial [Sphingomonadaceae bacterium]
EIVQFARDQRVELVVVGPESPLIAGLADALADAGIPCFGPRRAAAMLEGSKAFAKQLMAQAGVPTAPFAVFDQPEEAKAYLRQHFAAQPMVVKADGEALGKGVFVCETLADALDEAAAHAASGAPDRFGRRFLPRPALAPPFFAARVQGALFHTQGGLAVTPEGRVRRAGGGLMPNLFAAGAAARGLSGPGAAGYIAGNGLLSATGLGRLAGQAAARLARGAATGTDGQALAAREVAG